MFIASTLKGLEKVCCKEVNGKIVSDCRIGFEKKQEVRSALVVYELVGYFKFKTLKDIVAKVKKLKINIKGGFKAECNREGKHKFSSQEIKEGIGEIFYNKGFKVNLHEPETIIYADIKDNSCFIGLNPCYCGKRAYRIRGGRQGLNATIAYALLRIADFKPENVLLDPFCNDGVILVEAGLLGGNNLYGLAEYLQNAKIHAHVAKVKVNLFNERDEFYKLFKKKGVDLIITQPGFYDGNGITEMFSRAKTLLKKDGKIIVISSKIGVIKKLAGKNGLKGRRRLKVVNGDICYEIMEFKGA